MPANDELQEFQSLVGDTAPTRSRNQGGEVASAPTSAQPLSTGGAVDDVQWTLLGNDIFTACGTTTPSLPSRVYSVEFDSQTGRWVFITKNIITDDLVVLPDTASERVLQALDTFWNAKELFEKHGQLFKRGIMLWGPPGGGKTCTLMLLSRDIIKREGIVVLGSHPVRTAKGLEIIRRVEPDRPLICILEDIDEMVAEHGEHELLALLDGETQISNVAFVATTNYPERLDKRLVNRPSRFDEIIKVGMPSAAARTVYLQSRLGEDVRIERWVKDSEGFSVAHLRELVVAVCCLSRTYEETIERLRSMAHTPKSEGGNAAGFKN